MSASGNLFGDFIKVMDLMKNSLNDIEKEIYGNEVEEVQILLKKYDVILKDNIDEKDLIMNYETSCNQLNKYVTNKKKEVEEVEKKINEFSKIFDNKMFVPVIDKKKSNVNQVIDCNNRIVERIRDIETLIFNKRMKELDKMKELRYDVNDEMNINDRVNDDGMNIINNSMEILKQWSRKKTANVIFDSNKDGDGWKSNVLHNKIIDKSNLYLISFDGHNNVYGGYIRNKIYKSSWWISDRNSFVFSLMRNGTIKNKKYSCKKDYNWVFWLFNNNANGALYAFGKDIWVHQIGLNQSHCSSDMECRFDYGKETKPLVDDVDPQKFKVQRIVVLQMN